MCTFLVHIDFARLRLHKARRNPSCDRATRCSTAVGIRIHQGGQTSPHGLSPRRMGDGCGPRRSRSPAVMLRFAGVIPLGPTRLPGTVAQCVGVSRQRPSCRRSPPHPCGVGGRQVVVWQDTTGSRLHVARRQARCGEVNWPQDPVGQMHLRRRAPLRDGDEPLPEDAVLPQIAVAQSGSC